MQQQRYALRVHYICKVGPVECGFFKTARWCQDCIFTAAHKLGWFNVELWHVEWLASSFGASLASARAVELFRADVIALSQSCVH